MTKEKVGLTMKPIIVFTPLIILLGLSIYSTVTLNEQIFSKAKLDNDWTAYARILCITITAGYLLVIIRYLDNWFPDKQKTELKDRET